MTFRQIVRSGDFEEVPPHEHDATDISGRIIASLLSPRAVIGLEAGLGVLVAASDTPSDQRRLARFKCDGVDDDVQIQEANDEADAANGVIQLLPGTYIIPEGSDVTLSTGVTLRGVGSASVITPASSSRAAAWQPVIVGGTEVVVEGLKIDGLTDGTSFADKGIKAAAGADQALIRRVEFTRLQDSSGAAIDVSVSVDDWVIEDCYVHDTGQGIGDSVGILGNRHLIRNNRIFDITNDSGINNKSESSIITNNFIDTTVGVGIFQQTTTPLSRTQITSNAVLNAGGIGIQSDSGDDQIEGNFVYQAGEHGIAPSDGTQVHDNYVHTCGQDTDATFDGINLPATTDECSVQGNVVRHGGGATQHRYGINVSASTCDDNLVANNDLLDSGKTGALNDAGTGTERYGNRGDTRSIFSHFLSLGAGDTLTIAAGVVTATHSYHRIDTEAAAATDDLATINGGVEGDILILSPVSSSRDVTAKDGTGNLRLAGDFTFASATDTLTLVAVSTVWLEVSRSTNA